MLKKIYRRSLIASGFFFTVIILVFYWPEKVAIPVNGATSHDWNDTSFWFYPWGSSGVHRGIEIFAKTGQTVLSSTDGIVIYSGFKSKGGQAIMILGPK